MPIRAKVTHLGEQQELDIAVLKLASPLVAEPALFEENVARSLRDRNFDVVRVYGYPPPGNELSETELKPSATMERAVASNRLLNFQLEGGVREGYSGGPLVIGGREDKECCAGLIYLGGERAGTSRIIAAEQIIPWLVARKISVQTSPERPRGAQPRIDRREIKEGDRALVVSAHGRVGLSEELDFERIVFAPGIPDARRDAELRNPSLKKNIWKKFLKDMRGALALALNDRSADERLHVFLQVPYPAAFALGRMLDESNPLDRRSYRGAPTVLYQLDPSAGWSPFFYPSADAELESQWLGPLQAIEILPEGEGAILSIEGRHSVADEQLLEEARGLGAKKIYRCAAGGGKFLEAGAQARAAVEALIRSIEALKAKEGRKLFPLHILYSGPVSLCVELGTRLRTTVFGRIVVHDFDASKHRYYPVLELNTLEPSNYRISSASS